MPYIVPTPAQVSAIKAILARPNLESALPVSSVGLRTSGAQGQVAAGGLTTTTAPDTHYVTDYTSVRPELDTRYVTTMLYPEWKFQEMQLPRVLDVPSTTIGANTKGAYFPGTHDIWMNTASQYQGLGWGVTLSHERLHAAKNLYTASEEIETRLGMVYQNNFATDQLAFGAYHP